MIIIDVNDDLIAMAIEYLTLIRNTECSAKISFQIKHHESNNVASPLGKVIM